MSKAPSYSRRALLRAGTATAASVTLAAALPGIVFLSGGQSDIAATRHLDAINRAGGAKPWRLTFSYSRALQRAAITTWRGKQDNVGAAQRAFYHRARCDRLAAVERLIKARWPKAGASDEASEAVFARLQEIVQALRNLRNEHKVDPRRTIEVSVSADGEIAKSIDAIGTIPQRMRNSGGTIVNQAAYDLFQNVEGFFLCPSDANTGNPPITENNWPMPR